MHKVSRRCSFIGVFNYKYADIINKTVENPYNSNNEKPLYKHQLAILLKENDLLEEDISALQHPANRH